MADVGVANVLYPPFVPFQPVDRSQIEDIKPYLFSNCIRYFAIWTQYFAYIMMLPGELLNLSKNSKHEYKLSFFSNKK